MSNSDIPMVDVNMFEGFQRALVEGISIALQNQNFGGQSPIESSMSKVTKFDGPRNPVKVYSFLSSINLHFAVKNIEEDSKKVLIFGSHLTNEAQIWFNNLVGENFGLYPYEEVVEQFKTRFLPINYAEKARLKIKDIKQTSTVNDFIKRFNELIPFLPTEYQTEQFKMDMFKDGLKPLVRSNVVAQKPLNLNEYMELALEFDQLFEKPQFNKPNFGKRPFKFRNRLHPDAMDIDEMYATKYVLGPDGKFHNENTFNYKDHLNAPRKQFGYNSYNSPKSNQNSNRNKYQGNNGDRKYSGYKPNYNKGNKGFPKNSTA